jgi:hypothetical protein
LSLAAGRSLVHRHFTFDGCLHKSAHSGSPVVKPVPCLFSVACWAITGSCIAQTQKTRTLCNPRFLIILVHCGASGAFFLHAGGRCNPPCAGEICPLLRFSSFLPCQIRAQNLNPTATSEEGQSARHQNYWTIRMLPRFRWYFVQDNYLETCPPPYSSRL